MSTKAWKVIVHLRDSEPPQVILRTQDQDGRMNHLVVADKLFEPIGDLVQQELDTPRTKKDIQEKAKSEA